MKSQKSLVRANARRNRRVAERYPMFAEEFSETLDETAARLAAVQSAWAVRRQHIIRLNEMLGSLSVEIERALSGYAMAGVVRDLWDRRLAGEDVTFGDGGARYSHFAGWARRLHALPEEWWETVRQRWNAA